MVEPTPLPDPIETTVDDARRNQLRKLMGLITAGEVADLLGVSTHTLKMWRLSRKGPAFTKLGRQIFYRLTDINQWVAANTRTHDQAVTG